jgi:transposase InsO family protein
MSDYDVTLKHKPGKENVVADCLSRTCRVHIQENKETLKSLQGGNMVIQKVIGIIKGNKKWDKDSAQTEFEQDLWHARERLVEKNGYLWEKCGDKLRAVLSVKEVEKLWQLIHELPCAGHQGLTRTYQLVNKIFFCPGVRKFLRNKIVGCQICQQAKFSRGAATGDGEHIQGRGAFECIAVDHVGPLEETAKGHRYILSIVDTFTRFAFFLAVRTTGATEVAESLVNFVFPYQGLPKTVHSDRGSAFISELIDHLASWLGIKLSTTCAYHPEGNSRCERSHGTMNSMIRAYSLEFGKEWDEALGLVSLAYNSYENSVTGFAPFEAATGRQPVLPMMTVLPVQGREI